MRDAHLAPEKLNGCLHLRILHLESTIIFGFIEFDSIFGNNNQGLLAQCYFSGLYWQKTERFCRKTCKMVASICEFCIWSQPQHFLAAGCRAPNGRTTSGLPPQIFFEPPYCERCGRRIAQNKADITSCGDVELLGDNPVRVSL